MPLRCASVFRSLPRGLLDCTAYRPEKYINAMKLQCLIAFFLYLLCKWSLQSVDEPDSGSHQNLSAWLLADTSVVLPAALCSAGHVRFGRILAGRGLCLLADEPVDLWLE